MQKHGESMTEVSFTLWDEKGQRLYLNEAERERFKAISKNLEEREARTLCHMMLYTGCRITEALELIPQRIDWEEHAIMLRTLKKKGKNRDKIFRSVPVPESFLDELDMIHRIKGAKGKAATSPLWRYSRSTAWRRIKAVMSEAAIEGEHANPKGLRHGFGVAHALAKTPLPLLQRWMGHSSAKTTAIYMQATGAEERNLAGAVW